MKQADNHRILADTSTKLESQLWHQGYQMVSGVDEVGRGCLAGPVVAAAVVFGPEAQPISGVKDSKKLKPEVRSSLASQIYQEAIAVGLGLVDVDLINQLNIRQATLYAMSQALYQVQADAALVDGIDLPDWNEGVAKAVVAGDSNVYSIASASIIAKVIRDQLMADLGQNYPEYGWWQNVGYGTKVHLEALERYGVTKHHRLQFVRRFIK